MGSAQSSKRSCHECETCSSYCAVSPSSNQCDCNHNFASHSREGRLQFDKQELIIKLCSDVHKVASSETLSPRDKMKYLSSLADKAQREYQLQIDQSKLEE